MAHPTGIGVLDRKLDGGLPEGSLVAVVTPPAAQREPLLCASAHLRPVLYFSTVRSDGAVRKQFDRSPVDATLRSVETIDPDRAATVIPNGLADLTDDEDFIVDVVDPIEASLGPDSYAALLNDLTERLADTESVGYLHCYDTGDAVPNRSLTLDVVDVVWRLKTVRSRNDLTYELEIPKANGLRLDSTDRVLELSLGRDVYVDETRNI